MSFFTILFTAWPIFALLVIPAIIITNLVERSPATEPPTKTIIVQGLGHGVVISLALASYIAAFVWIITEWSTMMSKLFGAP